MLRSSAPGLYLHVPFCSAICPYCDFAVLVGDGGRRRSFVEALIGEVALGAPPGYDGRFDTVYLGGGTPSLLAPETLARILAALDEHLPMAERPWLALEANPEDVDRERLAGWRGLGVSFLSLGVQSFDAAALAFLGRRHGPAESRTCVERALAAGIETVSVDLIYGLPGQDAAAWRRELDAAAALAPHHLSCYQLTIEERTVFGVRRRRGELREAPESRQAELFLLAHRHLAERGYEGYEVSNFARGRRHRSRHNAKYWNHTPYLGLGPSAHSFAAGRRWWNERRLAAWERRLARGERPLAGEELLTREQLALEALMLGLRTREGIHLERFRERYGVDLRALNEPVIAALVEEGRIVLEDGRLRPTLDGLCVAEALSRRFELISPAGEG